MYPKINMKATGMRIRQIMDCQKLTVKDVQQYLNLSSVQSVYHWLKGQSMPTIDNLYALSGLFQLPIDVMIVGNRRYHREISDETSYIRIYGYCMAVKKMYAA